MDSHSGNSLHLRNSATQEGLVSSSASVNQVFTLRSILLKYNAACDDELHLIKPKHDKHKDKNTDLISRDFFVCVFPVQAAAVYTRGHTGSKQAPANKHLPKEVTVCPSN